MDAARTEAGVTDDQEGTRFYENAYELKTGPLSAATQGMNDLMCVDSAVLNARMDKGLNGMEEEAAAFAAGSPEHCKMVCETVDYVVNQKTSEKVCPNGIRDKGRVDVRPMDFTSHAKALKARVTGPEVLSVRVYTTHVYADMNTALRDGERYARGVAVPLPAMSAWATEGVKKLRTLHAGLPFGEEKVVLWRGMRSVRVSAEFMKKGGTELGFMSTTKELGVAVRYSLSRHSLLLKIVVPSFVSFGADLEWLSAFSNEAEVLYPPLTYLQPTGRTDTVDAVDRNGRPVTFTVVEVTPYIG